MGKVIEFNFSKIKEQEPKYTIQVDPMGNESVSATFNEAGAYWMLFIRCKSIDDIPYMREKALQQQKIQKAMNG